MSWLEWPKKTPLLWISKKLRICAARCLRSRKLNDAPEKRWRKARTMTSLAKKKVKPVITMTTTELSNLFV